MYYVGLAFILCYACLVIMISVRNILIGRGKIEHKKYKTEKDLRHFYHKGMAGLSLALLGLGVIVFILAKIIVEKTQ